MCPEAPIPRKCHTTPADGKQNKIFWMFLPLPAHTGSLQFRLDIRKKINYSKTMRETI